VAGLGVDGRGYVLEDLSCNMGPDGWARKAVAGYDDFKGDAIVVEKNHAVSASAAMQ
jgi:phage terminase large subunit-like protein